MERIEKESKNEGAKSWTLIVDSPKKLNKLKLMMHLQKVEGKTSSSSGLPLVTVVQSSAYIQSHYVRSYVESRLDALNTFVSQSSTKYQNIPGVWLLPIACQRMKERNSPLKCIGAVGTIIKATEPGNNFDILKSVILPALARVAIQKSVPIVSGLVITDTVAQANNLAVYQSTLGTDIGTDIKEMAVREPTAQSLTQGMLGDLKQVIVGSNMATPYQGLKISIIRSESHGTITTTIYNKIKTVLEGTAYQINFVNDVDPYSFTVCTPHHLPIGCKRAAEKYSPKIIIAIGCQVKNLEPNDRYLTQTKSTAESLMSVMLNKRIPIINCIINADDSATATSFANGNLTITPDIFAARAMTAMMWQDSNPPVPPV
ncbi:hypothetical protein AAMO2058_001678800 [Amorphochlora amoebiformis]